MKKDGPKTEFGGWIEFRQMKTRKKVSVEETDNCYLHISISINPFFLITAYIKGQGNGPNKKPAFSNNPVGMCGFITSLAIET